MKNDQRYYVRLIEARLTDLGEGKLNAEVINGLDYWSWLSADELYIEMQRLMGAILENSIAEYEEQLRKGVNRFMIATEDDNPEAFIILGIETPPLNSLASVYPN
jgi:hypothetical protein